MALSELILINTSINKMCQFNVSYLLFMLIAKKVTEFQKEY